MGTSSTTPTATTPPAGASSVAASIGIPARTDLGPAVVVTLVAIPLCLGIALASGAPLVAGVVSGIIGGIVVGLASPSHVQVSGPAVEVLHPGVPYCRVA